MRIVNPYTGDDITDRVREILVERLQAKARRAAHTQATLAGQLEESAPSPLGNLVARIHPDVYWHWVAREGTECWGDRGFRRDLLRDNPELRPRVAKPQNRISFANPLPRNVRESKTYPARATA